jgi:hypothetical protein
MFALEDGSEPWLDLLPKLTGVLQIIVGESVFFIWASTVDVGIEVYQWDLLFDSHI